MAWTGELESLRRRHGAHFLAVAEQAEPLLGGPVVGSWLNRLETEHDNLRAALDWSLGEHDRAPRLPCAWPVRWAASGGSRATSARAAAGWRGLSLAGRQVPRCA